MNRSPRVRLRSHDEKEKDKDGFIAKKIFRHMMEKQWKMELINSREDLILKRQLDLLTKQQRVVQRSRDKDMQVLQKMLEKKQSQQLQSPSTISLRSARSLSNLPSSTNTRGMSRKTSHVHVSGLPPLKHKSFSRLPDTGVHAISLPSMLHHTTDADSNADFRTSELSVEYEYRSKTPPVRRKASYQPVGVSTVEAVVSPTTNRHVFKKTEMKSGSTSPCQRQGILPPL